MVYLFIKKYYRSIIVGGLIFWLSLSESDSISPGKILHFEHADKAGHFLIYSLFSGLLLLDSCYWKKSGRIFFSILLVPLFMGGLMEIMQRVFTDSRQAEFADMLANVAGIIAGIIAALLVRKLIK